MERFNSAKKVGIVGVFGNILLFFIKIVVGIISRSQSMIADSINSAGDIFASLMTWLGNKISSVPNDECHNYGHGKAEYIFSMLISVSMILVSIKMLWEAIFSIINGNRLVFSYELLLVCVITIIVKFILYLYTRMLYIKSNNLLVKANMLDHRNDCFITFFTTLAILLTKINIYWFDGVVGIGISIWIFITGVNIFKDSYNVLMDGSIDLESKDIILSIIKSNKNVKRIGTLYSVPIGYKYIVVLTIYVDGDMSTTKSHNIADKLERNIISKVSKVEEVIIHVEPFFEN